MSIFSLNLITSLGIYGIFHEDTAETYNKLTIFCQNNHNTTTHTHPTTPAPKLPQVTAKYDVHTVPDLCSTVVIAFMYSVLCHNGLYLVITWLLWLLLWRYLQCLKNYAYVCTMYKHLKKKFKKSVIHTSHSHNDKIAKLNRYNFLRLS